MPGFLRFSPTFHILRELYRATHHLWKFRKTFSWLKGDQTLKMDVSHLPKAGRLVQMIFLNLFFEVFWTGGFTGHNHALSKAVDSVWLSISSFTLMFKPSSYKSSVVPTRPVRWFDGLIHRPTVMLVSEVKDHKTVGSLDGDEDEHRNDHVSISYTYIVLDRQYILYYIARL